MAKRTQQGQTTTKTTPVLVPRPDGRGALKSGGTPGNKGGGRPPSEVKKALRLSFEARIPVLEEIADNKEEQAKDRIRAVVALGQHSDLATESGDIMSHPDAQRFLAAIHHAVDTAIGEACTPAVAKRITARIEQLLTGGMERVA